MDREVKVNKQRLKGRYNLIKWFFTFLFALICVRLCVLTVVKHDEYLKKAQDNIYSRTPLKAERGIIYDRNMNILATNVTVYRVYISPRDIKSDEEAEKIAKGLSEIFNLEYEKVLEGAKNNKIRDKTIKKKVKEEEKEKVLKFITENNLSGSVHIEAGTERYYPYGNLACHTIGFMGTDDGLLGLEAYYNEYLKGKDGYYIVSKNAQGETIEGEYESYVKAVRGNDIITTIDVTVQKLLEAQLRETFKDSRADNRVTGIATNPCTGEVLAMATYPDFDLNNPYELDEISLGKLKEKNYAKGSVEYRKAYNEALYFMWNNKAVSTLYEPGSTFKIITTSVALETGVSKTNDRFFCSGALKVEGYGKPIHCHKRTGHGSIDFAEALQKSCNPSMMNLAFRIGNMRFMDYFEKFGYTGKTGIDLPGEAMGIYHERKGFNTVELAVYSFGQTFKITPLQQICAVNTVANGGNLLTPFTVKEIRDENGNIVYKRSTEVKRNVISKEVCTTISTILRDGVSGDGGAKNAAVNGYDVAAKTGTSQIRDIKNENLYIGSCVAYAPALKPEISVIMAIDRPKSAIYYGSTVAAPYVSEFLKGALQYVGAETNYTDEDEKQIITEVGDYLLQDVKTAVKDIKSKGLKVEVIGNGTKVISQVPGRNSEIHKENGKILLYTDGVEKTENKVPCVVGKQADEGINILINAGFNIKISGVYDYNKGVGATIISQDIKDMELKKGEVITIVLRYLDSKE